jgi:hypothetical protein
MHSTLNPKQSDDPHDILVVPPDVALVAPTDDELSRLARLAHESARRPLDTQAGKEPEFPAGATVPPVDTTFRPSAVDVRGQRQGRSVGGRALRAVTALLFAACLGGAAIAWQSFGYAAKQIVGKWAPQFVMTSSLQQEKPGLSAQPTAAPVEVNAAKAATPQSAPPTQTALQGVAPAAVAPTPESAQLLQSMARDLASMGQEIDQLKASLEQVKTNQQQMSRDFANPSEAKASEAKASEVKASEVKASEVKASEQHLRPRRSAPPRSAAAPARQRILSYPPPQAAAYPPLPQAGASYMPRPAEVPRPPITLPSDERDLSPAPRPPMPVR